MQPRQESEAPAADRRHDVKKQRDVVVKGKPDTYRRGHVYVQPVEGGAGWLAACEDLAPFEEDKS